MKTDALLALLALCAVVASSIGVIEARQDARRLFAELSRLESLRDELHIEYGRLQLEQATWVESNRLESMARGQLGMVFPSAADTVVIRR